MKNIVSILNIKQVTHDAKCFRTEKPAGYVFSPGQATDIAINKPGMEEEKRPFSFTSLNKEPYIEFTIKCYASHHGVTDKLHQLVPGDELIMEDVWGAITYKGPGYFIAGGAGITPFIAILRALHQENKIEGNTLFFSNKTAADIIYEEELKAMLNGNAVNILSQGHNTDYENGIINEVFLKQHITDFTKHFYICGPDPMVEAITGILKNLGANAETVVFEK
jgi:glycine betaine catabolism B